jgi:hypothetical protein
LFLVPDQYLISLPCEGFSLPNKIAKTVRTETKGKTFTASVVGGIHPTGGATFAHNRSTAEAMENQNDRVWLSN